MGLRKGRPPGKAPARPAGPIGERLDEAMRHGGFKTGNEAEAAAGLTRGRWSRLRGSRRTPGVEYLDRIASACKVDFEWLCTGRGDWPLRELRPSKSVLEWAERSRLMAEAGRVNNGGGAEPGSSPSVYQTAEDDDKEPGSDS